jgi:ABC-type oligopeptide transport system ATPase subunit
MLLPSIFDRSHEVSVVMGFLANPSENFFLVTGESGCGKSTILQKALTSAIGKGVIKQDSVLVYRFEESSVETEQERFPQFLVDLYAQQRPMWFLDQWMRTHGTTPESWAVRLPLASFSMKAPKLRETYSAELFLGKMVKAIGAKYKVIHLENVENYGCQHNLWIIDKLASEQSVKVIVEVGTLCSDAEVAIGALLKRRRVQVLQVGLFSSTEAYEYYRFIHNREAPHSLLQASHGNALAIRHYGTALAELPIANKVRQRLAGFSSDAMILLWCLAALRGSTELEFLKEAAAINVRFEAVLIELRQSDVIRIDENDNVRFAHSLFGRFFLSEHFGSDVNIFGRRRIIQCLLSKPSRLLWQVRELARQYYGLKDFASAWKWAFAAACVSYEQQDFRGVVELSEILEAPMDIDAASKHRGNMLLLQTAIRIGDTASVVRRLHSLDADAGGVATVLRAQGLYAISRFAEAVKMCATVAHISEDRWLASRALGVKAGCLIPLGLQEEAADDFAAARALAESNGDVELELELLRLSPELEPDALWQLRFDAMRRSAMPDKYPYLYAKCLHNYGAFTLLASDGEKGADDLQSAAAIFEGGGYPEFSYSAVMLAASMLLRGQIAQAVRLLEEAEFSCHEQCDTFGFKTNYGVAEGLQGDWLTASLRFQEAAEALQTGPFPFCDPYFEFQAAHNLAVSAAGLGRFDDAIHYMQGKGVPPNCYDYEVKTKRRVDFIAAFKQRRLPSMADCPPEATRWSTRRCIMELSTLHFYDFNVNVLPPKFFEGEKSAGSNSA